MAREATEHLHGSRKNVGVCTAYGGTVTTVLPSSISPPSYQYCLPFGDLDWPLSEILQQGFHALSVVRAMLKQVLTLHDRRNMIYHSGFTQPSL